MLRYELSASGSVVVIDSFKDTEFVLARKRPGDLKPYIERNREFPTFVVTGYENPNDPTDIRSEAHIGFYRRFTDQRTNGNDRRSDTVVVGIKHFQRLEDIFSPEDLQSV